jgi:hypothetical protein
VSVFLLKNPAELLVSADWWMTFFPLAKNCKPQLSNGIGAHEIYLKIIIDKRIHR